MTTMLRQRQASVPLLFAIFASVLAYGLLSFSHQIERAMTSAISRHMNTVQY